MLLVERLKLEYRWQINMCKANLHLDHWFIYGTKVVNNYTLIIIDEGKNDTSENACRGSLTWLFPVVVKLILIKGCSIKL